MSWFSGIGHALNKVVQPIDKLAPKLDPLNKFNSRATADTLGKIPVIGKGIGKAQGKIANHPVESAAALAALYYGGSYLLGGGEAGGADAGLAADSGSVNLFADAVPGAAGDVGSSALGDAAVGGASDAALGGVDGSAINLFSDAVPGAGGDVGASALGDAGLGYVPEGQFGMGQDFTPGLPSGVGDSAAPSTSSGFGGVGTDPSVAASPDGGLALGQSGGASAATTSNLQDALKVAMKYGPAGLSLLKGVMGKGAYARAAAGYGNVGATQRATANGLVQGYNNGTLNPAESAGIDRWAQQQVAALRQFYANAGTADSTQAKMAEAQVMAQATQMKNQASQNLLQVGLNELNTLDQNTVRGINANLQGDVAAQQAQANFAQQFAKLIGQTGQTSTPATTTGP